MPWFSSAVQRAGLLITLTAVPAASQRPPQAVARLQAAAHPFLGLVDSHRADGVSGGAAVVGIALDLPLAPRLLLAPSLAIGRPHSACPLVLPSNCPLTGRALDVSLLWQAVSTRGAWGLLLGPTVSRSSFNGVGGEVGGTASVGVIRGVGPRLTVHVLSRPGTPRQTRAMGVLSLRFGR